MLEQFKKVRDNPVPTAVFVTCVDSRMLPSRYPPPGYRVVPSGEADCNVSLTSRFTQTNVGDMFIVRNAGSASIYLS